jgi:phosphate transport system substrate-binding protein
MRILSWKLISIGCIFALGILLSGCAASCPPSCLGEKLGALDWNGRDLSRGKLINSSARQSNMGRVNFSGADLTGIDLSGADLSGSNLTDASLVGANMVNTFLSGVTFTRTDLTDADLSKADLTGAELNTSRLTAVTFFKTRMVNANLSLLNLAGATMNEAQMAGGNLSRVNLAGGVLDKIDLSGADLRYSDLRGAWINLSGLVGVDLYAADLSGASLIGSDLTGCNLQNASLVGANLIGANLRGADLRGADLSAVNLIATDDLLDRKKIPDELFIEMSAAQWEKLNLGDAVLDGAKYDSNTRWPLDFELPAGLIYMPVDAALHGAYPGIPEQNLLRISGSQTVFPLAKILAMGYMTNHPEMFLEISGSSSADGIQQVATSRMDFGMSSRQLTSEEAARYDALELTPIALDSILVVVNLENPLTNLSIEQIRSIFSGEITNWSQVGGDDLKIDLLLQNDSTSDVFKTRVMGTANVAEDRAQVLPSNAAVRATIAAEPGAIGLLPTHFRDGSLKSLAIDRIEASSETITSGKYPLVRPYYLVQRGIPVENIGDWMDFIFSEQGRQIILLEGLEPVEDER